jgi:hypothetical protein
MGFMPIQNEKMFICYGYSTGIDLLKKYILKMKVVIRAFDYIAIQVPSLQSCM